MQKRHKNHTYKNVKNTRALSSAKSGGYKSYEKGISLKSLIFRKKYKVEKGFYKVKHHKNSYKIDDFKAEIIKDYENKLESLTEKYVDLIN